MYNAIDPSQHTLSECESAVGRKVSLTLTGEIIAAGESPSGAYVRFRVDERFGFPATDLVMDLDPFMLDDGDTDELLGDELLEIG